MIQHLDDDFLEIIYDLIVLCFKKNTIPNEWKRSVIYPIAKPKPYNCELSNTRPITLLEVLRKSFIKIVNQKLSKIIKEYDILKGNQFAGLQGQSTFEPIRIIQEILQDAKEDDNELWILAQDMAKAYDRVNIEMLVLAMKRLRIPKRCIKLIKNLFVNQYTQVVTGYGLTKQYVTKVGIIQGEVISPLL